MATTTSPSAAAAAAVAAADEERRSRIIAHMNRSHTRELGHYIRHWAGASPREASAAAAPSIRDLTLQGMRIRTASGRDYAVPFDPPLDSWADAKARIIDMDTVARRALGISDIYVTEYLAPRGFDAIIFGAVVFYFGSFLALPWLLPGTAAWNFLDAYFPGGADMFRWLSRVLLLPVVGIHLTESAIFDRKLRRHGVDRGSGLWWAWVSSCFFEGVCAFRRLNGLVARKQAQKEGKRSEAGWTSRP
ncbi:hypothetical protein ACCO45_005050 [Purpureocillium lilacinum]|uniref:Uncharacterized protein n=1 Tax=Purpureocillium lilacinum TaxID=33203 RepID=A0ACC4DXE1_PURLI